MDEQISKYFQGELDKTERLALLRNVESDETLKKQFVEYQNYYALLNLGKQLENPSLGKQRFEAFAQKQRDMKRRRLLYRGLGYAAIVTLLVSLSSILTYKFTRPQMADSHTESAMYNTLYTPAGQRARLTLQDGTEVWLNAKSKLTYPACFTGNERKVTIEGEAYFDVAKDSLRPFVVLAEEVKMTVLGTQFNVYSYPSAGYMQTSLLEGSVRISMVGLDNQSITLQPNQQVTVKDKTMKIEPIRLKEHFLWRDGIYAFESEPLQDMLRKLELYYDVKIRVQDTSLFNEVYTGKFRQRDSLDDVFRVLQQIRNFKIEKDTKRNIVTLK